MFEDTKGWQIFVLTCVTMSQDQNIYILMISIGCRGRDRMVVGFITILQSVPITTKIMSLCSICPKHFPVLSSFLTYRWICN